MFLLRTDGRPLAASDDHAGVDPRISYTASDDQWVRLVVVSYDKDFSGTTELVVERAGTVDRFFIYVGGQTVPTTWRRGDVFTTTPYYSSWDASVLCGWAPYLPGASAIGQVRRLNDALRS